MTKIQLKALKQLRQRLELETCKLQFTPEQRMAIAARENIVGNDDTPEIREASRVWRQSYILPLLDALIEQDTGMLRVLLGNS